MRDDIPEYGLVLVSHPKTQRLENSAVFEPGTLMHFEFIVWRKLCDKHVISHLNLRQIENILFEKRVFLDCVGKFFHDFSGHGLFSSLSGLHGSAEKTPMLSMLHDFPAIFKQQIAIFVNKYNSCAENLSHEMRGMSEVY